MGEPTIYGLNVTSIIDEIRRAFPVGRPPGRPITGHRCDECDEVDRLMGGRVWTDVANDFPVYCYDTFPLLTPDAKLYYLPAYMVCDVASPGYMAGISVACSFEWGEFAPTQFGERQRAVIAIWIEAYYGSKSGGVVPPAIAERWTDRNDGT